MKHAIKGKKGIFFTFIAITIMGVFILIFTPQNEISLESETDSIETRISIINGYAENIQTNYYNDVLKSATYKSMMSLVYFMNETNGYLPSLNMSFSEVIIYGTLNGVPIDSQTGKKIMENNTLLNWTRRIEQVGYDTYNVNTTINISSISIVQTNPWQVDVTLWLNYTITSEVATWARRNFSIPSKISIEGWIDPAYIVESGGMYHTTIKRETTDFNEWNISYLKNQISNGTYIHWPYSIDPDYLTRFEGKWNLSSNCCGIHSLARPGNLTFRHSPDRNGSYVDYMLWNNSLSSSSDCQRIYNLTHPAAPANIGLWDSFKYFKLDQFHLERYNVTSEFYVQGGC